MVTTPLLEKKSSTKDVDKVTDELVDIPLMENKYPTKDVDKGTNELAYMKQEVVTIFRKGYGSLRFSLKDIRCCLSLIVGKQHFLQFIQNSINICF